jgi:hypothetical protein
MLFHQLSSRPHAKYKHGRAASITLQEIHGDMRSKWKASRDKTQSMRHQVEGPIMQEKEWTRAFGRCNSWSTRARRSWRSNDRVGRKRSPGEARGHPGPAGLPYKRSPPAPVFGRQASLSFLSLCAQVLVPGTTVDIDNLSMLESSKKIHTLNPLKVHISK